MVKRKITPSSPAARARMGGKTRDSMVKKVIENIRKTPRKKTR
jgi:hypothetical protein